MSAGLVLLALAQAGFVTVTQVDNGRCFTAGEEEYCLAGVDAPAAIDLSAEDEPLAASSITALRDTVLDMELFLEPVGEPDRWGRQPVLAFYGEGSEPVQLTLLEAGYVSLVPSQLPEAFSDRFRAAQLTAQVTERGLWSHASTRILYANEAAEGEGNMRFVRGRVLYTYEGRNWTYVNFGRDYETDFTIMIKPWLARRLKEAGNDPASWEGRWVEVYGLIHQENGPAIELMDGADIRLIPDREE